MFVSPQHFNIPTHPIPKAPVVRPLWVLPSGEACGPRERKWLDFPHFEPIYIKYHIISYISNHYKLYSSDVIIFIYIYMYISWIYIHQVSFMIVNGLVQGKFYRKGPGFNGKIYGFRFFDFPLNQSIECQVVYHCIRCGLSYTIFFGWASSDWTQWYSKGSCKACHGIGTLKVAGTSKWKIHMAMDIWKSIWNHMNL
jgi:hypothetical protein